MSKTDLDLYYELAMNIVRDAGQVSLIKYYTEDNKIFCLCIFFNEYLYSFFFKHIIIGNYKKKNYSQFTIFT